MERKLTAADKANLENYGSKCEEIKEFTRRIIKGSLSGMLLFGSGGNGKSYSIREVLDEMEIHEIQPEESLGNDEDEEDEEMQEAAEKQWGFNTWVNHQGRITPKGLVMQMARFPQSIHLVEDAETVFDDKNCWGLLRMALHSQDESRHSKRRVTWKTSVKEGSYDFWFTGGLIIVGNRLLNDKLEEVEAIKTRVPCLNFHVSNDELIAKMKEICERGYRVFQDAPLTKADCYSVLEFMLRSIENDPELKRDPAGKERKLNLRILKQGFRYLAHDKMDPGIVDWKKLILSQMKQLVGASHRKRADIVHDQKQAAKEFSKKKFPNEEAKLIEWCKVVARNLDWSNAPKGSPEYVKGYNAAKQDLKRKKA